MSETRRSIATANTSAASSLYGGALVALGLALAEFDYFWIANLIYSILVLAGFVTSAVKIVAYRQGL